MKIKSFDQNHIEIQDNSKLSKLILGLGIIAIAIAIILFWPVHGELECNRGVQNLCLLTRGSILTTQKISIPLEQVQQVAINKYSTSEGNEYYVMLITSNYHHRIATFLFSYNPNQIFIQINGFLTNQSQNNVKVSWNELFIIIPVIALIIFGAVFIGGYRRISLDLNRNIGLATIVSQKVFSSYKTKYFFNDLFGAEVVDTILSDNKKFGVALVRPYGQRILISAGYSRNRKGRQKIADEINRFLGMTNQRVSLR